MTPEAKVRNPVVAWAKARGVLHIRLHFGKGSAAGWPDDLFVYQGEVAFLEFKAAGEHPRALQHQRLRELHAAGAQAGWANDKDEAVALLCNMLGLRP